MNRSAFGSWRASVFVLASFVGCATTQSTGGSAEGGHPSGGESGTTSGGANGNPVLKEIEKVLDLQSSSDEPLSGDNTMSTDGTGTMLLSIGKLKMLTPPARDLVVSALGARSGAAVDLAKNPVRVRVEITKPDGRFDAKAFLELAVTDQAAFLTFLRSKPALEGYKRTLASSGVTFGADGQPDPAGKVADIAVLFDDARGFEIASARVRM
jgi:hypothetical protein